MSEGKLYPVPAEVAAHAWINDDAISGNVPALGR